MFSWFRRSPTSLPVPRTVVLTTFHAAGYQQYGQRFLESFYTCWPSDIPLWIVAEDVDVPELAGRSVVFDQRATLQALQAFKRRFKDDPHANGLDPRGSGKKNFRWDAVRFSNKVFAVTFGIRKAMAEGFDQLLWLDADTVTHREIPLSFIAEMAPRDNELTAYLNRKGTPECGWVGYNLRHPLIGEFADRFERAYAGGDFLRLKESHDSFIFWELMKEFEVDRKVRWKALGDAKATGHIFVNSKLGQYMDHLKGDRKEAGRSRADDLQVERKEAWWTR